MLPLAALALALTRPPAAYIDTGAQHVPLAISSWCWAAKCSAPIAATRKVAHVRRGTTVHIHLGFVPTQAALAVGGTRVKPTISGSVLTWRATRDGGLSLTATGVRGFVTYVGRLAIP